MKLWPPAPEGDATTRQAASDMDRTLSQWPSTRGRRVEGMALYSTV